MKEPIFENERIVVRMMSNNGSKVTITDKFAPVQPMSINTEAFEEMCIAVAKKVEERKANQL